MLLVKQLRTPLCLLVSVAVVSACEEEEPKEVEKASEPAISAAAPEPEPTPEPDREPADVRPKKVDFEVTGERRAAVEKAHAEAKGFLAASEIEASLKKNDKVKEESAAVKAFDRAAKGKWVLFTGTLINPTPDSFDIAVVYTPQMPNDPMGMSRQFFTVTLSGVEGYDEDKLKVGTQVVALAKYDGDKKATAGHELVASGVWK